MHPWTAGEHRQSCEARHAVTWRAVIFFNCPLGQIEPNLALNQEFIKIGSHRCSGIGPETGPGNRLGSIEEASVEEAIERSMLADTSAASRVGSASAEVPPPLFMCLAHPAPFSSVAPSGADMASACGRSAGAYRGL